MKRKRTGRNPVAVGAIVLVVIAVLTFLGFRKDVPFVNEPYTIKAAFTDGHQLSPGSPVRIAGVEVGRVREVELTEPRTRSAMVTMSINERGRPVRRDAHARIRPRIFLEGNFYIQLEPGTPSSPELEEGDTLPASQTSSAVQLDQVLKVLRSDVRRDLRGIFAELFRTESAGGAKALNRSLPDQAAAYKYSAIVAEALLGERPGDLGDYIRDQGIVSAALDRDREALRDLITDFNRTVAALADREGDLRAAVDELPRTLEAALPTLAALNDAFPEVRRFAVAARPGIRSSGPAARAATPFVAQLGGLFGAGELGGLSRDLGAAVPDLARVAQESVPLLQQTRLLSSCTTNQLVPWGNSRVGDPVFPASGRVHEEFPKQLVGLAGESRSFDANGQWFKVLGTGGLETFSLGNGLFGAAATELEGVNPPADRSRPPLRPEVPCETQQQPDLRSNPSDPPKRVATNPGSPAVQERIAKSRAVAIDVLRKQLKAQGSDVRVVDRDVTRADVDALAKALGLSGQLQTLTKRAKEMGR